MQIKAAKNLKEMKKAEVIILPFWQGKKHAEAACTLESFAQECSFPIESGDFKGKEGEVAFLYPSKAKRLLLLGLGEKEKVEEEKLRKAYAAAIKACRRKELKEACAFIPFVSSLQAKRVVFALCEGVCLANYAFDALKKETLGEGNSSPMESFHLIGASKEELLMAKKAEEIVQAVNSARDLVNGNADEITPEALAKHAKELTKKYPLLKTTILGKKEIEKEKMALVLAVGRGSSTEPVFIIIEYIGDPKSKKKTALIGKGVTFDTGGLNLKQTGQMETMRCDMAGAAAVLGTIQAACALSLKANIIGVIASVENAIGPLSYKPGDVYSSHSGKTVEVVNTDAEGRLILADALSYVQKKYSPAWMIDLATLTGSVVVALGEEITGLFCSDDVLAEKLIQAGEKTHEKLWRLPLYAPYKEMLKSSIADIKNSGGRKAGAVTAALFLQSFIKEGSAWAHLDIAGTAYPSDAKSYHPTLATGVGVRLLIELLSNEAS